MHYHTSEGNGQLFLSPKIILFITCNLGNAIFAWSILSWITHRNSYLDRTYFDLQVWYRLLQDSWCNICFLNFNSYYFTSLLFHPKLDIKSFNDSHIVHLANIDPFFQTSMLRWCLFFNMFITNWNIPPMFNPLLI